MSDVPQVRPVEVRLAAELELREAQVAATVRLFDEGATVPFVARYRKEVTGGLDDAVLRRLDERLVYLRELDERRTVVLKQIEEQGLLGDDLRAQICAADTKTRLEDLYLPYRPKRRTRATIARERGLQPLADRLLSDPAAGAPAALAAAFVDAEKEVPDAEAALEGARHILLETFAEDPELAGDLREHVRRRATLVTRLAGPDKELEGRKFRDWFDHAEPLAKVPSHRALAFLRGRKEGILKIDLRLADDDQDLAADSSGVCVAKVLEHAGIRDEGRPADVWLVETARLAWRGRIALRVENDLVGMLREHAEEEATRVFAGNLRDLLLAAPAGPVRLLGLDPGLRTGVKVAVVDETGRVLATDTVYPTPPREDLEGALATLERLVQEHEVTLISVGNGTGSRETDRCVVKLIQRLKDRDLRKVVVSEAGASVYSASELASHELPDLDVSLRGAVSIARRVQDPLAELVKIEPKAIGVGQYQHDIDQTALARALGGVVEDCVNHVGVDVNTASPSLLSHVAGLSRTLAENIVHFRDEHGAFRNRQQLTAVPRLGPKAFEQAAGFLRIRGGDNPLDASAVHPESYPAVQRIEERTGKSVAELLGDGDFLRSLDPAEFADATFGEPTLRDILAELEKPGRDPRPEWQTAAFQDGVDTLNDLQPGMVLEGIISNVTNFGAFVDLGVHQDGLIHVSRLSEDFVEHPRAVVKPGDVVKVKVLQVDLDRERVALSMRMSDEPGDDPVRSGPGPGARGGPGGDDQRGERGRSGGRGARGGGGRGGRGGARSGGGGNQRKRGGEVYASDREPEVPNAFARALERIKKDQGGS